MRKIDDVIAQITTERAPSGVCGSSLVSDGARTSGEVRTTTIASTNA